ncbi:MAG: phenylalanine--tRNA ligase subunit beta [Nitrospinae bacterium]|nr:phenylalanine--tRNA ligase subunit beta [Nitrospinota bacterium]
MKVTVNWLKDYVDIDVSDEEVCELLTMSGTEVEAVEKVHGETVLTLEVTSNRTDCLSVTGIARELSALLEKKLKLPPKQKIQTFVIKDRFEINLENKELCPYYTAHYIQGVKNCATPDWIKKRLEALGLRSINAVVDISNYVLYEYGQPMHTFDQDKLKGRKIIVRNAQKGEKITTIDGRERELREIDLVIADKETPIALAGVMGGEATEVSLETKNILLESAWFDPMSVKDTSQYHLLSSDSSFRFERDVNPENILNAAKRCADLIIEICGGELASTVEVAGEKEGFKAEVCLTLKNVERILGVAIDEEKIINIMKYLGFPLKDSANGKQLYTIPSFRPDCYREIDLIEEIGRIYGFNNIPEHCNLPIIPVNKTKEYTEREKIIQALLSYGYFEVITDSFVKEDKLWSASLWESNGVFVAGHPVRKGEAQLRTTLILSLAKTFQNNLNNSGINGRFYELAKIYLKDKEGQPDEKITISFIDHDYENFKGCIDNIISVSKQKNIELQQFRHTLFAEGGSASYVINDKPVIMYGMLCPKVLKDLGIKQKLYACEIDITPFIEALHEDLFYKPFSRFPASQKELSVIAKENVLWLDIEKASYEVGGEFLKNVVFIEEFRSNKIGDGLKSIHFNLIFQSDETTLSTEVVHKAFDDIIANLKEKLGISLRF